MNKRRTSCCQLASFVLLASAILGSPFALADTVRDVRGDGNVTEIQKVNLIEQLRSMQIEICETEIALFGEDNVTSQGSVSELKKCESIARPASVKVFKNPYACIARESKYEFASISNAAGSSAIALRRSIAAAASALSYLKGIEAQTADDLRTCRRTLRAKRINEDGQPLLEYAGFEEQVGTFNRAAIRAGYPIKIAQLKIHFGNPVKDGCRAEAGFSVYGCCSQSGAGSTPTITIDQRRWNIGDAVDHERIILHEMGHCVLNRSHHDDDTSLNSDKSMMNPVITLSSRNFYLRHRQEYLNELFRVGYGPAKDFRSDSALVHHQSSKRSRK
jgi:hypothetical protein